MPFLEQIVKYINSELGSSLKCFDKVRLFGITEPIIDVSGVDDGMKAIRYPAAIDNNGEGVMVDVNDRYDITLYHRLETINNGLDTKKGFGDSAGNLLEQANMSLMVIAFRDRIKQTSPWLESILKDSMPESLKNDVQKSVIRIGISNFDKLSLLNREYSNVELKYPALIFFEIKYRIESSYVKGCFQECNQC